MHNTISSLFICTALVVSAGGEHGLCADTDAGRGCCTVPDLSICQNAAQFPSLICSVFAPCLCQPARTPLGLVAAPPLVCDGRSRQSESPCFSPQQVRSCGRLTNQLTPRCPQTRRRHQARASRSVPAIALAFLERRLLPPCPSRTSHKRPPRLILFRSLQTRISPAHLSLDFNAR